MRYEDINSNNTPFLSKLQTEGRGGPLRTLLAFEGIAATLFTGTYPSQHGIWTRYYADAANSAFKWMTPLVPLLDRVSDCKPVVSKMLRYSVMKISNSLVHASYFPGIDEVPLRQLVRMSFSLKKNLFETGCFSVPSLFDILAENAVPYRYIDHGLFDSDRSVYHRAVTSDIDKDVVALRFIDLDTASHNYGLEGQGRVRALRDTDRFVERIVSTWRQENPNLAVLCFADHGMVPVESSINVEALLSGTGLNAFRDFGMFLDSTMARFWGEEPVLSRIRRTLERVGCGRILSENDLALYKLPSSPVWGNMIFLLNPGFVISPNFFDRNGHVKAMHGYDPSTPGLETMIVINWPEHITPRELANANMIDLLPTALEILGLKGPPHLPGKSLLGS